jgi:hypothetical protein
LAVDLTGRLSNDALLKPSGFCTNKYAIPVSIGAGRRLEEPRPCAISDDAGGV